MRKTLTATSSFPALLSAAEMPPPAFVTIDTWLGRTGMGRRSVYDELGRGNLRGIKVGTRTLIDFEHGMKWLRSRPAAVIKAPRPRNAP
jgi:hypothetical protein